MNDPTRADGHRLNRYVIEWQLAVAQGDDAECHRIADELPEEDRYPFVVCLGHHANRYLTGALGRDPVEDLKLQLAEMDLHAMGPEEADEP